MSLLEMDNIQASYGASQALFDINLSLNEGEVMALMGRNGMGKTTTVKTICKILPVKAGAIRFSGIDITSLPSYKVGQLGIGLVPEGRRCFHNLNVEENLRAAANTGYWNIEKVSELFPRLAERLNQNAGSLSGGEQQMLSIGRALMTNPKLLILDEATEGLAPVVRQEIWKAISLLKQETGMAILIIDKSMKELASIADKCTLVQRGETVWSDKFSNLDRETVNRYIGI